jgi:hypothetical protein
LRSAAGEVFARNESGAGDVGRSLKWVV